MTDHREDYASAVLQDEMLKALTRIADCLTRVFIGISACAGLLTIIAFVLILRWVVEAH